MAPSVSVVIAAYNSADTLPRCLAGLAGQNAPTAFEVIVVDDASSDDTARLAEGYSFVRVVRLLENSGPGHARNQGMALATGDIILFTDADAIPEPDWLSQHLLAQQHHDIVCGAIGVANPESWVGWAMYLMEFVDFFPGQPAGPMNNFTGCNASFKCSVLRESSGFDPRFRTAEDRLFALQLSEKHAIYFEPKTRVLHINRTTLAAAFRNARRLGEGSGQIRKLVTTTGDAWLVRFPLLVAVTPFFRFGKMLVAVLRNNQRLLPRVVIAGPLTFALACTWAWGFRQGLRHGCGR